MGKIIVYILSELILKGQIHNYQMTGEYEFEYKFLFDEIVYRNKKKK
jgi:hypothetical protein